MITKSNYGAFLGRTLLQSRGEIGGARYVFVKLQGSGKDELVFPTFGVSLKNPFKGAAKAFAGDLIEYRINGVGYLLKTFEAKDNNTTTKVEIVRDGFRHKPFVGDILMVAPATASTRGASQTVVAVEETEGAWVVTFDAALTIAKGDILVEAAEAGASVLPLVTNPNTFAPCDYDMFYEPAKDDEDFDGARYFLTPALHGIAYVERMSPVPAYVKALNKSRVEGWFEL